MQSALVRSSLEPLAHRLVDSLSGGERQRAWLAMMLAQDTHCLLLDEPTSALDIAHAVEVLGLVQALSRERDIGIVIVLHDINMAARYCDEILALRDGLLIARGSPQEIVAPTPLHDIYGLAMQVMTHPHGYPVSYVA